MQLHHYFRVQFGPSHLFAVTVPTESAAAAKAGRKPKHPTWEDAQAEIAQHTGLTTEGADNPDDLLIQVCAAAVAIAAAAGLSWCHALVKLVELLNWEGIVGILW